MRPLQSVVSDEHRRRHGAGWQLNRHPFIKAPPALASTSKRELTRSLVEGAPLLHQQNIHSKSQKKQAVVLVSMQCGCCGVAIVFFNDLGINDIVVAFGPKQLFRCHLLPRCTSRSSARRNGCRTRGRPGRQTAPFALRRVVRALQMVPDGGPPSSSG